MSNVISRRISVVLGFGVLSLIAAVTLPGKDALAGDVWANRALNSSTSNSYFDNGWFDSFKSYHGTPHSYVISNGISSNNVTDFVAYLKAKNRSGAGDAYSRSDKAGAAFIVHTILGRNGDQANANGGRNISDADFNDLRDRLNSATINWNTTVCDSHITTMSVINDERTQYDVQRDRVYYVNNNESCESGITITDRFGSVYRMQHKCANPVGYLTGIATADFNLVPTVTGSKDTTEGGGSQVMISPNVENTGSAKSRSVAWQLTSFRIAPNDAIPAGGVNGTAPVSHYGNSSTTVANGSTEFERNNTPVGVGLRTIGDYPIGTRICYTLSVNPYNQDTTNWRHGTPFCVTIAKSPKLQVHGGDIRVGSNYVGQTVTGNSRITTNISQKTISGSNYLFGSWGEYGVFAPGVITGIGSGSAFAGTGLAISDPAPDDICSYTFLTFSNATTSNCKNAGASNYGGYNTGRTIPNVAASFPVTSATGTLSGTVNVGTLNGRYKTSGDITLSAATITAGKTVIINTYNPTTRTYANVTIAGDIRYANGAYALAGEIPQLIILAGNININNAVTQLDAWVSAEGTLNTCADVPRATITSNNCDDKLTINGPVMANQVQLWRTAGSGTGVTSGDPAEVFNLRPDAYLWAISQNAKSGRLESVYQRELPPRY